MKFFNILFVVTALSLTYTTKSFASSCTPQDINNKIYAATEDFITNPDNGYGDARMTQDSAGYNNHHQFWVQYFYSGHGAAPHTRVSGCIRSIDMNTCSVTLDLSNLQEDTICDESPERSSDVACPGGSISASILSHLPAKKNCGN